MPQRGVIEKGVCDLRGGPALPAAAPGRLAAQLWITCCWSPRRRRRRRAVGIDIPVQWYADDSGQMTLDRFAALPADQLATTRQIPPLVIREKHGGCAAAAGHVVAGEPRWLQLGPTFVDHLTIYYRPLGSDGPWTQRIFGDRDGARGSDLHYRERVLILPLRQPTPAMSWSFACRAPAP